MDRRLTPPQRALLQRAEGLAAAIERVRKACDDADAHDWGHGHWISTAVVRAALGDEAQVQWGES